VPAAAGAYPFGAKVAACARAEELAAPLAGTLTWLDASACWCARRAVRVDEGCDAALRPVHLRNVGLPPEAPLDAFWRGIYAAVGLADAPFTVRTFLDDQPLRAYFNSHGFSVNPRLGLLRKWEKPVYGTAGGRGFSGKRLRGRPAPDFSLSGAVERAADGRIAARAAAPAAAGLQLSL
jgi:hypothetical protein